MIEKIELTDEIIDIAYNKNNDKEISESLAFLTFKYFLSSLGFDQEIIKESPIVNNEKSEFRNKLFELNHAKINGNYIHLIEVNGINKDKLSIDKKLFDNNIISDYYVFININKISNSIYIIGYLSLTDIQNNLQIHDEHFYKIISYLLRPIKEIPEKLKNKNAEKLKEISPEVENNFSNNLVNQLKDLSQLKDDEFISDISYIPESWYKTLLQSELCSKLYLKSQESFKNISFLKSNLFWNKVFKSYNYLKENKIKYEEIKNNFDLNSSNIIEIFKNNNISQLKNSNIIDFINIFENIDAQFKLTESVSDIELRTELIKNIKSLNKEEYEYLIREIKLNMLILINKSLKYSNFMKININEIISKIKFNDINTGLARSILDSIKKLVSLNLLKFEDQVINNFKQEYLEQFKSAISKDNDSKIFRYCLALSLYYFSKSGKLNLFKNFSQKEIALIADLGVFTVKKFSELNEKKIGLNNFEDKLIKKNISSFLSLLDGNYNNLTLELYEPLDSTIKIIFGESSMLIVFLLCNLLPESFSILSKENVITIKNKLSINYQQIDNVKNKNLNIN